MGELDVEEATFECESDSKQRTVPVVSLEELLARFELDHIDVLLLDVQGAEVGFLRGALDLLAERVRFVIVSTHHHVISGDPLTHQRCLELVEKAGGTVISEHTVGESYSGDGMIAASFDPRDAGLRVEVSRAGQVRASSATRCPSWPTTRAGRVTSRPSSRPQPAQRRPSRTS